MKTSRFTLTLPVQITDLLPTGIRRSMFIQDTLVQRLKLDPVTLSPLDELEFRREEKLNQLRQQSRAGSQAIPATPAEKPGSPAPTAAPKVRHDDSSAQVAYLSPEAWGITDDKPLVKGSLSAAEYDRLTPDRQAEYDSLYMDDDQ